MYKEFQELAEIIADLSAMLVKDQGKTVSDDYSNLEAAAMLLGLAGSALDGLKRINGLRNVLVHEYNRVIDRQAYDSIGASLLHAKDFLSAIKKWPKTSKKK